MSPLFDVQVVRTETYTETIVVEAASAEAAEAEIEKRLEDGWDAVFPNKEGEYDECSSGVGRVEPHAPDTDD